ncbi:hypothetical protein Scep_010832 [Stephania cephalantha]|uniref:Uncharacterized protein n=1 Tax=Stephania cephalantha TaxID=152367 RepID=A0AAP0JW41_9MAGN
MSHSLTPSPHAPITLSTKSLKKTQLPFSVRSQRLCSTDDHDLRKPPEKLCVEAGNRRTFIWGLAGGVLGLSLGEKPNAVAAAKRKPAAPQAEEKKDPNVSGVQAKVLASKKRKEAMKEAIAKLRENGKAIVSVEKKE